MALTQQRLNTISLLSVGCIAAAVVVVLVRVEALSSLPPPKRLQQLLEYHSQGDVDVPLLLPCCYDGLTARLVARAGFDATFMTGFGYVSNLLLVLSDVFTRWIKNIFARRAKSSRIFVCLFVWSSSTAPFFKPRD